MAGGEGREATGADASGGRDWTRFLKTFAIASAAITVSLFALSVFIFWRAGEYLSPERVVSEQHRANGVFRTILHDRAVDPSEKLARYRILKPEIIALGSSRLLSFRQEHFTKPFLNMGMFIDNNYLSNVARQIAAAPSPPKLAIVSLDFWQFHGKYWNTSQYGFERRGYFAAKKQALLSAFLPFRYLFANPAIGIGQFWHLLCKCDPATGRHSDDIGVAAVLDGSGISRDGSIHYTWIYDPKRGKSQGFASAVHALDQRSELFSFRDGFSADRFEKFMEAMKILAGAGTKIVAVVPPMAPTVADAMAQDGGFTILPILKQRMAEAGIPTFDYHDARQLGASDCEFVDAIHSGEVTALRMLDALAEHDGTGIAQLVDREQLRRIIAKRSGYIHAYEAPKSGPRDRIETDFLGLGCRGDAQKS